MKPILILQLRASDLAADGEFKAFLRHGGLSEDDIVRIRMEQDPLPEMTLSNYAGVIVGGGPWNVSDPAEKKSEKQQEAEAWLRPLLKQVVENDHPYMGACYGLGILCDTLGAPVSKERYSEPVAGVTVNIHPSASGDPLLEGITDSFRALGGHKEAVQSVPIQGTHLAASDTCPVHMVRFGNHVYGTQFHPELDAPGLCERIDVYKNAGYFPPEEAEPLKNKVRTEVIRIPMNILRRWVELCRRIERENKHD